MAKYVSRKFKRQRRKRSSLIEELQCICERIASWRGHKLKWNESDDPRILKGECTLCGAWIHASLKEEEGKDPIWGPMQITFCDENQKKGDQHA